MGVNNTPIYFIALPDVFSPHFALTLAVIVAEDYLLVFNNHCVARPQNTAKNNLLPAEIKRFGHNALVMNETFADFRTATLLLT